MKSKTFITWALALSAATLAMFACSTVLAQETPLTDAQKIRQSVNKTQHVADSRVFTYEDCAIIAIRPNGIYLKSESDKSIEEIRQKITTDFPQYKNVKITTSPRIFKAIEDLNLLIQKGELCPDEIKNYTKPPFEFFKRIPDKSKDGAPEN